MFSKSITLCSMVALAFFVTGCVSPKKPTDSSPLMGEVKPEFRQYFAKQFTQGCVSAQLESITNTTLVTSVPKPLQNAIQEMCECMYKKVEKVATLDDMVEVGTLGKMTERLEKKLEPVIATASECFK